MASWKKADLTELSEAPMAQGRPFAYVTGDGSSPIPRVLYTGQDSHIHELRLEGGSWNRADLMDQVGEPPDAVGFPFAYVTHVEGTPISRVIYRGNDNHVHELRLEGGGWRKADLMQQAGGAPDAQGNPTACVTAMQRKQVARVVFRAADNHLHEVRLEDGSWKQADLSELAGASDAAGDPSVYVTENGSEQTARIVYRGPDAHIHELRLEAGGSWKKADLSQLTSAPDAASEPFASVPDGIPRVIFRGADSHVQELRLDDDAWKKADLTSLADASSAEGRPAAYASDDHTPRVVYRSGNGHITELRLESSSWKKADLTDLSGAPPAAGDPIGYVTPTGSGSTPRVVYRDSEGHLRELRLE
ncbi:MAG TPA: hypothetical protein VF221_13130 [Chloroflexota bacterium]